MITRTTKTSLLAAAALMMALPAMAQPAGGSPPASPPPAAQQRPGPHGGPGAHQGPHGGPDFGLMRFFDQADTNLDGKVDEAEARSLVERRFAAMDANKDGAVTLEEWQVHAAAQGPRRAPPGPMAERMKAHQAAMFRAADADRDGKVTPAELSVIAGQMFRMADANGDGAITRDELPQPPPRPRHGQPGPQQPGGPAGGPAQPPAQPPAPPRG